MYKWKESNIIARAIRKWAPEASLEELLLLLLYVKICIITFIYTLIKYTHTFFITYKDAAF